METRTQDSGLDLALFGLSEHGASLCATTLTEAVADAWPRQRYVELGAQICREVALVHERGEVVGVLRPDVISLNLADYPMILPADVQSVSPYSAPEIGAGEPNARSDVFGIGGLLYFMFTGGESPANPDAVAVGLRNCAPELAEIVSRCLAQEPSLRYGDVDRVASALMSFALHDQEVVDDRPWENPFLARPESSGPRPALRSTTPPCRRNKLVSTGVGLGVGDPEPMPWGPRAGALLAAVAAAGAVVAALLV